MNPGDILDGRYQIVARLGAGGMGEVYKATHTFLGASRVIKVVHPNIAGNDDAKDRFLREAKTATRVQHQNVATLHDFASLPDGSHYMVWEFIDGENLAQRLRTRGTLPPRQAVHIAIQALHGLEAIHKAGIVHRDISPENLMITDADTVKIIDLGVAKVEDTNVSQTRTGIFVGKLRYAAPEQLGFLPDGEKIDGRADLYAMAMVIVELLTGRPPYEAKSPHEYFMHHAREIPLTTVELPKTMPASEALQEILQKALKRNREERFASAAQFAAALEEIEKTLPDASTTETMMTAVDGDATWTPSQAFRETAKTPARVAPTQALTPAPAAAAMPAGDVAAAETIRTPLPASAPMPVSAPMPLAEGPRKKGISAALVMVVLLVAMLAVAGGAFALWPKIGPSMMALIARPSKEPAAVAVRRTPPAQPAQTTVAVTPSTGDPQQATIVASSAAPVASTASAPATSAPSSAAAAMQPPRAPRQVAQAEPPTSREPVQSEDAAPRLRGPAVYTDGPGRYAGNDRAIARLRQELRGVHSVSLLAGSLQVPVYRTIHQYIPDLEFDADSNVVIHYNATPARMRYDQSDLSANVTIEKDGRVIFSYNLPGSVDPAAAADGFAQVLAEALQ